MEIQITTELNSILLHPDDDVVVLKRGVAAGARVEFGGGSVVAGRAVTPGHKIALRAVAAGAPVKKYGQIIGFARGDIAPGDWVHTHNLELRDFARDYAFGVDARPVDYVSPEDVRTFQGYARADGRAGTRNYVAVIASVNCSASVSQYVARHFSNDANFARDYPHVDGVLAFTHKGGCGLSPDEPLLLLQRVLAGVAKHPNISGYVLIGLGCEVNQVDGLVRSQNLPDGPAVLTIQRSGGIRKTVDAAIEAVKKILPAANAQRRTMQPASKLILAENCGGSDGNSGITANPALGLASDELVRQGGTSVLAETPEIYGAEHLLTRRALSREIGEKLIARVRWWEAHAKQHNATIDNNPSPGNKEGGLTTIYEKSLGAVAKGGQSPLAAVYQYAEQITAHGFCFMDTPGFDPVSMTGLMAGGCNVGVFTTGRGSVYGCKPAPCIKIATNTALYNHMIDDMDLNAGTVMDGTETLAQVGARIFEKILAVAGGEKTKSELAGIGDEEFAPWPLGPTF